MNRFPVGILFALGGLVVLVLAYLATRKGGVVSNIGGDVGSKIILPGLGSSASPGSGSTSSTVADAAASTASPYGNNGAFMRYGKNVP